MLKPRTPNVLAHWAHLEENFTTSAQSVYEAIEDAIKAREAPDVQFSRVLFKEGGIASADREYLRVQRGKLAFDICAAPYGRGFFFSSWLSQPGPRHAVLWLAAFLFAVLVWINMLISAAAKAAQYKLLLGETGGSGIVFTFLLFGAPALLFLWGWAISLGNMLPDEDFVLGLPILGALYVLCFNPNTYYRLDTALMFQKTVHNAMMEVLDGLLTEQGLRALSPEQRQATIREFAK